MEAVEKKVRILSFIFTRGNYAKQLLLVKKLRKLGHIVKIAVGGTVLTPLSNIITEVEKEIGIDFRLGNFKEIPDHYEVCKEILSSGNTINENNFDFAILVGDRYELLSAATICLLGNIKILHIEGGERSGSIDEGIRHAITKLSHLHATSNDESMKFVESLGENQKNIINAGSPNLDWIKIYLDEFRNKNLRLNSIDGKYLSPKKESYAVLIHHPMVYQKQRFEKELKCIIDQYLECSGNKLVIVAPNLDADSLDFWKTINKSINDERMYVFRGMNQSEYAYLLSNANFAFGNSSSLIRECPFIGINTLVLGDRQAKRLSPKSVRYCNPQEKKLVKINIIELENSPKPLPNQMYGDGQATDKIIKFLLQRQSVDIQK